MQPEEVGALEERYRAAREYADRQGTTSCLERLQRIAEGMKAVVNTPVVFAYNFFFEEIDLYAPYAAQVRAKVRGLANFENDSRRRTVESRLYGTPGEEIVYAALSVDGAGLTSYGPIHLELEEITVAYRATVLEENSYQFIERHDLTPGKQRPLGYLARWEERGKLAVAKLVDRLVPGLDDDACGALLLESHGYRNTDMFLEVHIYGIFNYQAVRCVGLPDIFSAMLNEVEVSQVKAMRERLPWLAINWRAM